MDGTGLRVSADIDQSELLALINFFNMRNRYGMEPKMWRTGKGGVHFISSGLPLHWEEAAIERALFRDDESRVDLDLECSMKPFQTLFGKKREERGYESKYRWSLDEQGLLALPFWISRFVKKNERA